MSRTGIEPKPPWRRVPEVVRREVGALLGSPVQRGVRIWGGYAPSPTFRLLLADGRRAFLKGVSPESNEHMHRAYADELRVYQELDEIIGPWAPAFYGAFKTCDWSGMLLEDLGPKSVPPWPPALTRRIARAYGEFHASTLGRSLPDWVPDIGESLGPPFFWGAALEPGWIESVAGLAGERSGEAVRWLAEFVPLLRETSRRCLTVGPPYVLLHLDTRSDNLRWKDGRLYLFDWPYATAGHPEKDAAAMAQSIAVEGGPPPEQVLAWYSETMTLRPELVDAAVASLAGFFAHHAWREEIPGLPRLRGFQRRQLKVTLRWAAARLSLPDPVWTEAVPD